MKKTKTITAFLTAVTMTMSAVGMTAHAVDNSDIEKAIAAATKYDTNNIFKDFDGKLDDEEVYRCYGLDGLYDYNDGNYTAETFEDLIEGKSRIYIKLGSRLATIIEKNGELSPVDGETLPMGYKSVLELQEEEQKLRQQIDEEIAEVKYCGYQGFGCIHLSVVYFKTVSGKELCVPYIDNYNFEEEGGRFDSIMENGRIYTGEEMLDVLKNVIPIITEKDKDSDDGIHPNGTPSEVQIIGDVDEDGIISSRDCAMIARAAAKRHTQALGITADYNKDGRIDVRDAAAIAKYVVFRCQGLRFGK